MVTLISLMGQNAISDWDTVASTAIITKRKRQGLRVFGLLYASIAVYDAVNAVHRPKFEQAVWVLLSKIVHHHDVALLPLYSHIENPTTVLRDGE